MKRSFFWRSSDWFRSFTTGTSVVVACRAYCRVYSITTSRNKFTRLLLPSGSSKKILPKKKQQAGVIGRARSHTERQNYSTFTVHIPGSDKEKEEGRKDRQAESTSKRRDPNEGIKNRIDKGKGKGKVKTKTNIQ